MDGLSLMGADYVLTISLIPSRVRIYSGDRELVVLSGERRVEWIEFMPFGF